jgi:hypothetical protein
MLNKAAQNQENEIDHYTTKLVNTLDEPSRTFSLAFKMAWRIGRKFSAIAELVSAVITGAPLSYNKEKVRAKRIALVMIIIFPITDCQVSVVFILGLTCLF